MSACFRWARVGCIAQYKEVRRVRPLTGYTADCEVEQDDNKDIDNYNNAHRHNLSKCKFIVYCLCSLSIG